MWLFVGLGNPGSRYERNRHNVGFMAVEAIARRHGAGSWRRRFHGRMAEVRLDGQRVLLFEPETYMNESGRAVAEAVRFYKIPLERVVVFHDELDLAPGKLRIKTGGGTAGHRGLESIAACLGSTAFRRVRIGIGRPQRKELVVSWVLSDFDPEDRRWLDPLLEAVAAAAPRLVRGEDARFIEEVTRALRQAAEAEGGSLDRG